MKKSYTHAVLTHLWSCTGGRKNMLINVKLGVPEGYDVDVDQVRATFPYGRLLPVQINRGGLTYNCGRYT